MAKDEIIAALQRMGELAQTKGYAIELVAVGGAVMVLAYNARLSTHDVDVFIVAPRETHLVRQLARQVAQEQEWPEDCLNDGVEPRVF